MKLSIHRLAASHVLTALLAACAGAQTAGNADSLNVTAWVLADLPGQTVLTDAPPTLGFESGRAQGSDGCNRYMTTYASAGAKLTFSPRGAGTRMACPPARTKQADAFMDAMLQVRSYRIEGGKLILIGANGGVLATLARQRRELAGSTWRVTGYNNGRQAVVSPLPDSELTVTFAADGRVSGSAGCNGYTGAYTSADSQVAISSVAATRRMCDRPAGVMEQEGQFLKALETVASARFEGNRLELRSAGGALAVLLTSE